MALVAAKNFENLTRNKNNDDFYHLPFFQNKYEVRFTWGELQWFDNKTVVEPTKISVQKFNRTYTVLNITITTTADMGENLRVLVEGFKFLSNEYRHFPIRFEFNYCKAIADGDFGLASLTKCGNFTGCPMKKILIELFKFLSNEYRNFAVRFEMDLCKAINDDEFGLGSLTKCGNFTKCPLKKMIVRVFGDGANTDVPVTPATTCSDVIECCRDPGEESCDLVAVCPQHGECALQEGDHPLEILQRWGSGRLFLRYTVLSTNDGTYEKRNGMKEPDHFGETLPEGVQLTLGELREMACRQQAQIDSQHQLLAAKEQRLRYLKDQEARQHRVQAETERLRRLRDRVDAQELKLRKLRALRGQVDHHKQNNITLTSDLDSIRALFNEKEKELSLAVAKVEELTRQLEELKRGRSRDQAPPSSALELDKLRRELMYRNKLNEQQNHRLNQQREALTARQEEMTSIDKRISELQERLHRKRLLNQQLATQITAVSNKAAYHQLVRLTGSTDQNNQFYGRKQQSANQPLINGLSRGNIATVEPYNHVPLPNGHQVKNQHQENTTYHPVYQQNHHAINTKGDLEQQQNSHDSQDKLSNHYPNRMDEIDALKEFSVSKSDPKYQTLPYNTKFTVNLMSNRVNNRLPENNDNNVNSECKEPIQHISSNSYHMTAHSAPLNIVNKNVATPLSQNDLINRKNIEQINKEQHLNNNYINGDTLGENVQKYTSTDSNTNHTLHVYQKPISSVAPTAVNHLGKLSNVYQTSSIKVQPVEPQTVVVTSKQLPIISSNLQHTNVQSPQSLALSPPQANSTPIGTPEVSTDKSRPALPPKPAIKPPPRQTQASENDHSTLLPPPPVPSTDPPEDGKTNHKTPPPLITKSTQNSNNQTSNQNVNHPADNMPIIKAKPLTIKKQPLSEQPKLRNVNKLNGVISSSNRRIEIPPVFHFPEVSIEKVVTENPESIKEIGVDEVDKAPIEEVDIKAKDDIKSNDNVVRRCKKGNLKQTGKANLSRRVSFDPLALLLDASLEGELELVKKTATQVTNPSAANDEGITALHNAICAGHFEIVQFLVEFGCDVNAQDSDGWTPLHCAASCNNVAMVKFLVEHGACIFATTLSDHETAAEKCEEDEEGFDGCSEYLYSVQEKLGILSGGVVYAVFDYNAQQPDELSFCAGQQLMVLRKGDESEREWWWSRLDDKEGYVPRNLLGLYSRVSPKED